MKSKLDYYDEHRRFPLLIIVGILLILLGLISLIANQAEINFLDIIFVIFVFIVGVLFVYLGIKRRRLVKLFDESKNKIINAGKKANGEIVKAQYHYVRENTEYERPYNYLHIEYFDEYTNRMEIFKTERLSFCYWKLGSTKVTVYYTKDKKYYATNFIKRKYNQPEIKFRDGIYKERVLVEERDEPLKELINDLESDSLSMKNNFKRIREYEKQIKKK